MRQARLDRCFTSQDAARIPHRSYFLALPFHVRCNIYLRAELVPGQYTDLNHWAPSRDMSEFDIPQVPDGSENIEACEMLEAERDR